MMRAFTSLRYRNFRLLWLSNMISLIGGGMQIVGQTWLVLQLTHSPLQIGVVGALQYLPIFSLTLFGGVVADRWPKRFVLLVTQTASMLQALLLWVLVLTGTVQLWHIYLMSIVLGIAKCVDGPTSQSMVVEVVGREDLPNAIALNSSLFTLARILGPGLAGIIIAVSGVTSLFLFNALSFLPVLLSLLLMRVHELHIQPKQTSDTEKKQSTWQSLSEGMAYVWRTSLLWRVLWLIGLVLLFGSNFNVLLPLFATDVLHMGPEGYGFLSAAFGVGALLSTLWLAWRNQRSTLSRILLTMLIFAVLEAAFAISHLYLLSLLLIAAVGFAESTFAQAGTTLLQTLSPDHLQGRIMSVEVLFFDGSVPMGYLLVGWLSMLFGASVTLLICASLCLLVITAGWIGRKAVEQPAVE